MPHMVFTYHPRPYLQPHPHSLPGWLAIGASGAILIDEGGGDSPYGRWRASTPPPFAATSLECARGLSRAYSSLHWSAVPLQLLRRATITHGKACAGGLLFTLFTVVCTAGGVELIARDWQLRWLSRALTSPVAAVRALTTIFIRAIAPAQPRSRPRPHPRSRPRPRRCTLSSPPLLLTLFTSCAMGSARWL